MSNMQKIIACLVVLQLHICIWPKILWAKKPVAEASVQVATIKVDGMVCGGCEKALQNKLLGLKGVKSAKASYREKNVKITYNSAQTDKSKILGIIIKSGYNVKK